MRKITSLAAAATWVNITIASLLLFFASTCTAKQRVLLYSKTAGYRHASIPDAIAAFEKLGKKNDIYMFNTENEKHFENATWVNNWDAMVFVSVSGTMLSDKGAVNMMKYIENGGGFMGVHEACDAMYKSPWYGRLLGAYFDYHPYLQSFTLDVAVHNHPSTSFLDASTWKVTDEVYTFNSDPRKLGKTVVLTANPHSYSDPTGPGIAALRKVEGAHPIAWYKEGDLITDPGNIGGGVDDKKSTPKNQRGTGGPGRAFYTALGHTKSCWQEKNMVQHVWGGLSWVLNSPTIRSNNASLPITAPGTASAAHSGSSSTNNATNTAGNGNAGSLSSSSSSKGLLQSNVVPSSASSLRVVALSPLGSAGLAIVVAALGLAITYL